MRFRPVSHSYLLIFFQILQQTNFSNHRQSMEWIGNVGKIANVVDATFVMRPDTLYFRRFCIYKF